VLSGLSVLLTAGPTWEAIDPVRGITNHSSGKMGYALAQAARDMGAHVSLISGPVCLSAPDDIELTAVQSARDMYDAVHRILAVRPFDIFVGVAAVADYRPAEQHGQKLKKSADELTIRLIKNPDIVASVAGLSNGRPFTVGFAAETQSLESYARGKLRAKNLDMIIANDVSEDGVGFGAAQNRILMITGEQTLAPPKMDKDNLAQTILKHITSQMNHDT